MVLVTKSRETVQEEVKVKVNFCLSGALARDEATGNMVNGVVLKWREPLDTALPKNEWRLYVFKVETIVENIQIHKKSVYLFGRDKRVADVVLLHPASSKQHALIQFRKPKGSSAVKPYLMDLQSANKTFFNGKVIEDSKDTIRFGLSEREYVLMVAD